MTTTPAPPPPDVGHELSGLLENRDWLSRRQRRNDEYRVSVDTALLELENWLNDGRTYVRQHHRAPWKTMAADVSEVLGGRGPEVVLQTPSITALFQQLQQPDLGADQARRQQCRQLVTSSSTELAEQATITAAFNDLVAAAEDLAAPAPTLQTRVDLLECCLRAAGRTVSAVLESIGRVLDDTVWGVNGARGILGDPTLDLTREDIDKTADLPIADRLDLCRRLLQHHEQPGNQLVWFCLDDARIRESSSSGTTVFGPVTFYDGPALTEAVNNGTELHHLVHHPGDWVSYDVTPIPVELPKPGDRSVLPWFGWPPKAERWVAVRVDLGQEQLVDPVRTAALQVDTLLQFASFYTNGTRWRRMRGYKYVRDGGGASSPFRTAVDARKFDRDHTDFALEQLAGRLGSHLPIRDPHLQELLDAAATLYQRDEDLSPASIVDSARVIERVAGLCNESWIDHLTATFAIWWARDVIQDTVATALHGVQECPELHGLQSMPDDEQLYNFANGDQELNYDVAIEAMPHLGAELPDHHPGARLVRTVASRTATPANLAAWVAECVKQYARLLNRLLRCRNSLVHGGPLTDPIARTVQGLARVHAKRSISMALWAVADGSSLQQAHQQERIKIDQWRDGIPALPTAADAFRRPAPSNSPASPPPPQQP
jgi:hypothetical protein